MLSSIRNSPSFAPHAQKQGEAVKALLNDIGSEDVEEVSGMISDVGFPASVQAMLLSEIDCASVASRAAKEVAGPLQNWTHLYLYGTESFWKKVRTKGVEGDIILHSIVSFLLAIGLRHPSCPTYRVITCLYCWLRDGYQNMMDIPKRDKFKEVKKVKTYFRLRQQHCRRPSAYVVVLPDDPSKFMERYPKLASVYKDAPLVNFPLDADLFLALSATFPLRRPKYNQDWDMDNSHDPSWSVMPGKGALMQLMQMNAHLVRKLAGENGCDLSGKDGSDIRLEVTPPKKKKTLALGDIIRDGPPATPPDPLPLMPPEGDTAESPSSKKKVMKKKKKKIKKKATAPDSLVSEPAISKSGKLTTDALGACSGVLESMLARHNAKKKKGDTIAACGGKGKKDKGQENTAKKRKGKGGGKEKAKGKGKENGKALTTGKKGEKRPLGCSKCRFLQNGCADCR